MPPSGKEWPSSARRTFPLFPLLRRRRASRATRSRGALFWIAFLPLVLLSGVLSNWIFLSQTAFAAPTAAYSAPGQLTAQQALSDAQQVRRGEGKFKRPQKESATATLDPKAPKMAPLPSSEPASMLDAVYTLDDSFVLHRPAAKQSGATPSIVGTAVPAGVTPFQIKGSDGRLEVDLPRGSLDFAQAKLADGSAPVGELILQIHQLSGHATGEGRYLGYYRIQVVDSQGNVVQGVQVVKPYTLVYHYQKWEMQDLGLNPAQIRLSWPDLLNAAHSAKQSDVGLVTPMVNDAKAQTLTAQSSVIGSVMTASGTPSIDAPSKPDLFEASGNSGQYSYSYPINVAPGPAGFIPHLALSYSSQSTNVRYGRSPGGDEGDGWSLSLGSITATTYPAASGMAAGIRYSINDVDGISDKLMLGTNPNGKQYVSEHYSHLMVENDGSYWKVWGKDGTVYELGNTGDSVQQASGTTYEWDVDKIIAPTNNSSQAKTMFIRYYQDKNSSGDTRDVGIDSIQYGYATSTSATSLSQIMGTVGFYYRAPNNSSDSDGQGKLYATAYSSSYYTSCNPPGSTSLRCDDPVDYNGVPAPAQMPTLELSSIVSYVGDDKNNVPAYRYDFGYQTTPYSTTHYDPGSGVQETGAGSHLLTSITPTMYVAGQAKQRQPIEFGYSGPLHNTYEDHSQSGAGGHYSGQTYWHYLNWYEDLETGTGASISYATAYANMQGTPYTTDGNGNVTDDRYDPLYCTYNSCTGSTYGYPDEKSWSLQVVTSITALGTDSNGDKTLATTAYSYSLQDVSSANSPVNCNPITGSNVPPQEADCVLDTWVPGNTNNTSQNDNNWTSYYDAEFRGFNVVYTTTPANNLTVDAYFTTDGWWSPESNGDNFNGGQRYEEKIYQGPNETDSALLKETLDSYAGVGDTPSGNPYSGINTCNGNVSPVFAACVVASLETKVLQVDGGGLSSAPWLDTKYTYDDINVSSGYVPGMFHNLQQEVISGSNLPSSVYPLTKKWQYQTTYQTSNNYVTAYTVDTATHSETDDASGHVWQCQDTTYDEGAPSGMHTPMAGWPTTKKEYTTCGTSSTALTSYTAYDQYGNVVATVDPLRAANVSTLGSRGCGGTAVAYVSPSWTGSLYTTCMLFDSTTEDLPTYTTNVLGQTIHNTYDMSSTEPLSGSVDLNGQTTSYVTSYDSTGNETIQTSAPGETPGSYTSQQTEHTTCTASSILPCYEIDTNNSLYSSAITRTFYDQQGRVTETITPGPTPGDETVVATVYYDELGSVWKSVPFQVVAGTGWIDPLSATDINGHKPGGTQTFSDALGRTIAVQDPNWGSSQEPGQTCSWYASGTKFTSCTNYGQGTAVYDSTNFEMAMSTDADGHVTQSFTDAAGNVRYTQTNYGLATGTLSLGTQVKTQYNALGKPISITTVDGRPQSGEGATSVTTSLTYDDTGRLLTVTDPDQGTLTYTYDQDNHMLSAVQTSGSHSRTTGYNYDLLGRLVCEQQGAAGVISWNGACSGGNPLIQNTYDTTVLGVQGTSDYPVGQLTQSVATTYYPDSTSATVTEQFQHDQRQRLTNEQIQLGLPTSWNVTAGLPLYQEAMSYNDANQVTTTSTTEGSAGYTFTSVYDPTNGVEQGLSNNSLSTANLATLSYNEYAELSGITLLNGASSSPTSVATEQYGYDADQRPISLSASWLPGSGNSGQIVGQSRSYDNAGNVTSLATTFAPIPGQTGSGGAQTENFCYDEMNRLLWSGNSGTQPAAGTGTCGSGTLANSLSGAGYSAPYVYSNLGQIWQGPLNHQGSQQQYLYCNSNAPHQLTGIYPLGTTCATMGSATAVYSANYDPWGNQTMRTTGGVTGTLSYDQSNRLTEWNAGANSQEYYLYDATGNRILKRSITGTGTTLSVYSFGLEENDYTGTGVLTTQTHYYNLAGHLIGSTTGATTTFYMTDGLDSVLTAFGQSAIQGEQVYGPFGASSYQSGQINTAKGYTGQVHDGVSGLDYYVARYYDPVMGMFLSVDTVQGNQQGMDPYAYVGNSPEVRNDPSGQFMRLGPEAGSSVLPANTMTNLCIYSPQCDYKLTAYSREVAWQEFVNAASIGVAVGEFLGGLADLALGDPSMDQAAAEQAREAATADAEQQILDSEAQTLRTGACSFTSATVVETSIGKRSIGTLHVGDKVLAYNPLKRKMELQPILHVWIHSDDDLVDLTITSLSQSADLKGKQKSSETSEVVHTNKKHPFFTAERGFLPVGQIKLGMHVLSADGHVGVITGWKIVPGAQVMYNLEVAQDHTFTVGFDDWIVHNCGGNLRTQFDNQILKDYDSGNKGLQTEAEVGLILRQEDYNLTGYKTELGPKGSLGEIDAETPDFIVEAKSGNTMNNDFQKVVNMANGNDPIRNPFKKPVIVYAPNLMTQTTRQLEAAGVYVARNEEELLIYAELLTPSS